MFITFEGIDGSGKSTQAELLARYLEERGIKVLLTREPGGTGTAEAIRNLLLHTEITMDPMTEVYLYCAARNEHVEKIIKPGLALGLVVISDRFYDSTIAYQGGGRDLGIAEMIEMNRPFREKCKPDVSFFVDTSLVTIAKRLEGKELDRMEREGISFMDKVQRGYMTLISKEPERFKVVSGDRGVDEIAAEIRQIVEELL